LICACIDIGSNTTRLLVADAEAGRLRELVTQRAFTRIGRSLGHNGGSIPAEKIAETAARSWWRPWRARAACR
jgi:exopolyphosphatase/guanosine-5'-triphosphate,3'-diphosphate pyrophosphatase